MAQTLLRIQFDEDYLSYGSIVDGLWMWEGILEVEELETVPDLDNNYPTHVGSYGAKHEIVFRVGNHDQIPYCAVCLDDLTEAEVDRFNG